MHEFKMTLQSKLRCTNVPFGQQYFHNVTHFLEQYLRFSRLQLKTYSIPKMIRKNGIAKNHIDFN